jgi:ubiquinone biosynthesis protein
MAFSEVREAIEREFGAPASEVFAEVTEEPLASASIGQVHLARTDDGRSVVVKVQRPDAEPTLNADVALMYQVARMLRQRVSRIGFIDVVAIVDEFARTSRDELDYRIEGRNAEVIKRNFANDPRVDVPSVLWEHTTERVLTMEAVPGTPLSHLDLDAMSTEDRKRLAHRISETWMAMVFDHGFFHADPHPANILVQSPDRLSLVDFGMVGQLMPGDREATVRLFVDILDQNAASSPVGCATSACATPERSSPSSGRRSARLSGATPASR